MRRRRLLLIALVAACAGLWLSLGAPRGALPGSSRQVEAATAYASPLLAPYLRYLAAVRNGDALTLQHIADGGDGYLAYRASLELARWQTIDATTRLSYYHRVLALRIHDPAARQQIRALYLEVARTAEQAGAVQEAIVDYRKALPLDGAAQGLARLEPDPKTLAQDFLDARMYQHVLDALGTLPAPSLRARAEYRMGHYAKALPLYRAWKAAEPDNNEARYGIGWCLYQLQHYQEAIQAFRDASGESATYGHALAAQKLGDIDTAVKLLESTRRADDLWKAASVLEDAGRPADALPLYLQLASGGTGYADDAAYRAYVLAGRLGDPATAQRARSMVPKDSFFALKLGEAPDVPPLQARDLVASALDTTPPSPNADPLDPGAAVPEALQLADALAATGHRADAVGTLLFHLRGLGATTGATGGLVAGADRQITDIAARLQQLGEYRQSVYAARQLILHGSRSLEVWRLAYPTPYTATVERQARADGISPFLVWSIMRRESGYTPLAVSTSDAIGLMQVTKPTWDWLAQLQGDAKPADPFDPTANIRYGSYYLGYLVRYFHGNVELAVPSYNRGQGYIHRLFDGPHVQGNMNDLYRAIDAYQTREYMQAVLRDEAVYRALYPDRYPATAAAR